MGSRQSRPLNIRRRQAISLSQQHLVETSFLNPEQLPLVIQPAIEGVKAADWAATHRDDINCHLAQYGAILFRNFDFRSVDDFKGFIQAVSGELLDYRYRSTARHAVSDRIYTSTDYPSGSLLPLHCEMAYKRSWPLKIFFFCRQPATEGGETPIADNRKVSQQISAQIRNEFVSKRVMYVRNYGHAVDLSWQDAFQTDSKVEVEQYCRTAEIEWTWGANDQLRTRQICQSIATHPRTQDIVWFNAAHLHHVSSFDAAVYEQLLQTLPEEKLPRNAYYGDGSPIPAATLTHIKQVYQQEAIFFPWQQGDVLLLDNMLVAHGRAPFSGVREIVVGMSDTGSDIPTTNSN